MEDNYGHTPLCYVVKESRFDLVSVLINHGADINYGYTPLHYAVLKDTPIDTLRQLISHKNVKMKYHNILGPLHNRSILSGAIHKRTWDGAQDVFHALHQCGAEWEIPDVVGLFTQYYNMADLTCLLQHLNSTNKFVHFAISSIHGSYIHLKIAEASITINSEHHLDSPIPTSDLLNMIYYLLEHTCLYKNITTYPLTIYDRSDPENMEYDAYDHDANKNIGLKKLCILSIRQHMPYKTDDHFTRLGLPPTLLPAVTFSKLACDLHHVVSSVLGIADWK